MHRFYLPPEQCRDSLLRLEDREAHHALHVLRIRAGEQVVVLDGRGTELLCEVRDAGRRHLELTVVKKAAMPVPPSQLTLLQAIPKGKIIESIIQRATELGVSRIVPILSERVVTHLDQDDGVQKAEKWQQVAIEAIKQCGSRWLPQVETPVTPKAFCARKEKIELPLIASLREKSRRPRQYFQKFQSKHQRPPASIGIWIGPEGDFTDAEVDSIIAEGAQPITLGDLVLRVETAATYCLSVLNNELADLSETKST